MEAFFRPASLWQALNLLERHKCRIAAGCTDLFPATAASRLGGIVMDITGIAELRGIEKSGDYWRIGAATTWSQLLEKELPPAFDALKQAGREVGSVQIQNSATIAGNICNASPAADGVPCLLCLDAEVEVADARGRLNRLRLPEFILGPRKNALQGNEIVSAILIPESSANGNSAFLKLGARKHLVISIAMAAARIEWNAGGRIGKAALSVGACSPVAVRLHAAENFLAGRKLDDKTLGDLDEILLTEALEPISDVRASSEFRRAAAAELAKRTLAACLEKNL